MAAMAGLASNTHAAMMRNLFKESVCPKEFIQPEEV
jgi:hypothetical protein